MIKYIFKKLLYSYLVILGVLLVCFFFFHILPGDPISQMCGKHCPSEKREAIVKHLGLDKPLVVQLGYYLNDFSFVSVHLDNEENRKTYKYASLFPVGGGSVFVLKWPYLRRSFQSNKRVDEIIFDSLEGTFWLAISAMIFATFFGILFGLIAALNKGTYIDHLMVTGSTVGVSSPSFVTAILMSMFFGFYLGHITGLPIQGYMFEPDFMGGRRLVLKNLILPCITLGIRPLSIITQLTRSSMIEVLSKDFIRTAKAKGVGKFGLIMNHAMKNALNPVITAVSGWLASLMAGAFFVEYIFNWKGIGASTIRAVQFLDMPVVLGMAVLVSTFFVLINIIVDIIYVVLDPRVRLK